jgi:hypothetical protein
MAGKPAGISCVSKRLEREAYVLPHPGVNCRSELRPAFSSRLCMASFCGIALV